MMAVPSLVATPAMLRYIHLVAVSGKRRGGALNLIGRKVKKEIIPQERNETIRQELVRLLEGRELPVGILSKEMRLSEKEIYAHLEQIKRTSALIIIPAECRDCGYVFAKRDRPKKPGKCPICKGTHIEQPLFSIASK